MQPRAGALDQHRGAGMGRHQRDRLALVVAVGAFIALSDDKDRRIDDQEDAGCVGRGGGALGGQLAARYRQVQTRQAPGADGVAAVAGRQRGEDGAAGEVATPIDGPGHAADGRLKVDLPDPELAPGGGGAPAVDLNLGHQVIEVLLPQGPGPPELGAVDGDGRLQGLALAAGEVHRAPPADLGGVVLGRDQLPGDDGIHVAGVEVVDHGLEVGLGGPRLQPPGHVDRLHYHAADLLQPDPADQPQRPPALVVVVLEVGQRPLQLPPHVRGLDADRDHVAGLEVRGDVETEMAGETVVAAQELAVEPDVGGGEGAVEAQQRPLRPAGVAELRAVPDR